MAGSRSDAPLEQLPASLLRQLQLERFNLHQPEVYFDTSADPAFDTRYFPHNCGVVELPCYWIQRRHLWVFGRQRHASGEVGFFAGTGPNDGVLFPIHPTSASHYSALLSKLGARDAAKEGLRIWAVPTSSTRTFLAWPDRSPEQALFVKTSLHSQIFGDRRLPRWRVARSIGLSRLVHDSLAVLPTGLSYFPEAFGVVPRHMPDSGFIARSIPAEIKANHCLAAPLFSLMGGRPAQPLLLALIEQGRVRPLEFIEEVLCAQFARLWLEMALRFGLILEAHGQDLMLALSLDLQPSGRFYYRDFEGMQVDWELRHALGLSSPESMPNACAWHETYSTWGYRYGEQTWYKLRISLLQYLHFVLHELEVMVREWQDSGLLSCPRIAESDITAMFSRKMMIALDEMFGVRASAEYDLLHSLNRFVLLLMDVRHSLLRNRQPPAA